MMLKMYFGVQMGGSMCYLLGIVDGRTADGHL